jgi:hypothetical protein
VAVFQEIPTNSCMYSSSPPSCTETAQRTFLDISENTRRPVYYITKFHVTPVSIYVYIILLRFKSLYEHGTVRSPHTHIYIYICIYMDVNVLSLRCKRFVRHGIVSLVPRAPLTCSHVGSVNYIFHTAVVTFFC